MISKFSLEYQYAEDPMGFVMEMKKTDQRVKIPNQNIPLSLKQLDNDNICTLNTTANTIQFSKTGYYKVSIIANAYVPFQAQAFDSTTDFVALGLRLSGTDNIYIGDTQWITNESSQKIIVQGIINVDSTANLYEIANITKRSIFLNAPKTANISTTSTLANPLVSITIEYLGQ